MIRSTIKVSRRRLQLAYYRLISAELPARVRKVFHI